MIEAAIVSDNGLYQIRALSVVDDTLRANVPDMISPKMAHQNLADQLSTRYPMDHDIISNREDMELFGTISN